MRKKKNRFILFWLSLMPGAGEMYLGFMKMGLSLLVMFILGIVAASELQMGILALIPVVVWIYGFFHANNLGGLDDETFYGMEDRYLGIINEEEMNIFKSTASGKYKKVAAILLILIGLNLLFRVVTNDIKDIFYSLGYQNIYSQLSWLADRIGGDAIRIVIGVVIIWFGFSLIRGKKKEIESSDESES